MTTGAKAFMTFWQFDAAINNAAPCYPRFKYFEQPLDTRQAIFNVAIQFVRMFDNLGPLSSLELVLALGSWLNEQPEVKA